MPDEVRILWKDRKRILGMPITFTKYSISEDRLFLETGLLNIAQEEILLYRVRDISLPISLGQRIFGVGSVIVQSSDKTMPTMTMKNIKNPKHVKELLHQNVEEMKLRRKMRVGEILGGGADAARSMDEDEMDPDDEIE